MTRLIIGRKDDEDLEHRTLGWLAIWWIEHFVVRGPGDVEGEPITLTDEYCNFLLRAYALDENGRRLYSSAFLSRPKGTDKSGLAGYLCLFEALGPCRFLGWAQGGETYDFLGVTYTYERGEAMGRMVTSPFCRIMATEEGQASNVYDVVKTNLSHDDSPLYQLKAFGLDYADSRTLLPWGGEIRPSTGGSASKDGGKETWACFDEVHLYTTHELRSMYDTVTRNLPKRGLRAEPWYLETTTMYEPGADSIAERTFTTAQRILSGKQRRGRLLFDHRYSDLPEEDMNDEEKLRAAIAEAYGDALEWNSVEDIIDKIFDWRTDPRDSMRYYLNQPQLPQDSWLSKTEVDKIIRHVDPNVDTQNTWREIITKEEPITLGFDGSVTNDATALVGCRVSDGLLFPIRIEEQPDGPEAATWTVDVDAFNDIITEVLDAYNVVAFFADPPYWQEKEEEWEKKYGETLKVKSSVRNPIKWWTNHPFPMALALNRLKTAIRGTALGKQKSVAILGEDTIVRHFENARARKKAAGVLIYKETPASMRKIDAAMAATLAYEARGRFLQLGSDESKNLNRMPQRVW